MDDGGGSSYIVMFLIIGVIYLLPTIMSLMKRRKNILYILFHNVVFGWMPFVWLFLVMWITYNDNIK